MTIRVVIDLEEVTVAGVKYLSNMHQDIIDKYPDYYVEDDIQQGWKRVEDIADLERATKGTLDDAEQYCFIKLPSKESGVSLRERIQNHLGVADIYFIKHL
jgi:hypothetical protein